ncbi:hypothetical protein Rhe02_89440 [Rhizocola hellebori]|uniref:Class I SAM-dependent methyltransferase n=1 Tax=Rhizocola hellebori TaxID=1392758 RepID=A0A8J3QJ04_9ACTN|nr:methyltransferase domain-containing protein [Rhizocola hellebori]GIH10877.1 hypothetical protein Rhe02_89440 [Rhizocola hellebori]
MAEHCVDLLQQHRIGRLLDAGGGDGYLPAYLHRRMASDAAAIDATVLDHDHRVLAQVPAPMRTVCGRLEDLDASTGQFGTILLRQVLHYVVCPDTALRTLGRRLESGGVLYVGQMVAPDPASADWLGNWANWISTTRLRVWTPDSLFDIFSTSGLLTERAKLVPYWQRLASAAGASPPRSPVLGQDSPGFGRIHWLHATLRIRS